MSQRSLFTHTCLHYAQQEMGFVHKLKEKQLETLHSLYEGKDTIAVLPTGFGKSVIFQLLPFFLQKVHGLSDPMIVLVVAPLNSIMQDQVRSNSTKSYHMFIEILA